MEKIKGGFLMDKDRIIREGIDLNSDNVDYEGDALCYYDKFYTGIGYELFENGNIKIVYPALSKTSTSGLTAFFIPHKYPDSEQYRKGVEIVTLIQSRPNPNAKISNPDLRKQADEIIANRNVFEVLLIEESGIITECSRANIFFIKQDQIITSPESLILKGITREYIFKICNQNGISLKEKIIHQSNLQHVNATFITGTSPKVLPVCKIDEYSYTTDNPLLLKVMELYNKEIDKYILKKKAQ